MNNEFLEWCKEAGNNLITPHPEFGFPGLKDGDSWCVCAGWYAKAVEAGKGCPVFLKKTHEFFLKILDTLFQLQQLLHTIQHKHTNYPHLLNLEIQILDVE